MITLQNWQVLVEKSHDISMFLRDPLTDKKIPRQLQKSQEYQSPEHFV